MARFVGIGGFSLNVRLSPWRAFRLLLDQQVEFLGSEGKTVRGGDARVGRLPAPLLRTVRAARWAMRFAKARRPAARPRGGSLELPVDGDIAIVRRSGAVKVLDHARRRVATVMTDPGSRAKLRERLATSRRVEGHAFAPRVQEVELDAGWFTEELIVGTHPTGFAGCHDGFDAVYLPLLVAFARAETPLLASVGAYATAVADGALVPDGLLPQLPRASSADVAAFVTDMRSRIVGSAVAGAELPLVLSHGDFFSGNVVAAAGREPRAIDWANLGRRSPMHDLYFVIMNHCVRVLPPARRQARLGEILSALRGRLEREDPERFAQLDAALSLRDELRWLFYLECVAVPLERCDDPADRYVTSMLQRVAWFRAHEAALAGGRSDEAAGARPDASGVPGRD